MEITTQDYVIACQKLQVDNAELKNQLHHIQEEIGLVRNSQNIVLLENDVLKDKLHRRNMLCNGRLNRIKGLVKLVREYKKDIVRLEENMERASR